MKRFLLSVLKFIKKVFLVVIITSAAVFLISIIMKYKLSTMFSYAGLAYMIIGGVSMMGNASTSSSADFIQSQSVSSKSMYQNTADNLKSKDDSFKFMLFMVVNGGALLLISSILEKYNL